jgi:hypothetical protein
MFWALILALTCLGRVSAGVIQRIEGSNHSGMKHVAAPVATASLLRATAARITCNKLPGSRAFAEIAFMSAGGGTHIYVIGTK